MSALYRIPIHQSKMKGNFEFHVSREARERYKFDQSLFQLNGNVIFANFGAARKFAQKINAQRDLIRHPEQAVKAGQINAMGLIDEILHMIVGLYKQQVRLDVMADAISRLEVNLGEKRVETTLKEFSALFPPLTIYNAEISLDDYYKADTSGASNKEILLEEMLMLWLANMNPAFMKHGELFDDTLLEDTSYYTHCLNGLYQFFAHQPPFGADKQNLIDFLRMPAILFPDSLEDQLRYMMEYWGSFLGEYLQRLLRSLDMIQEEEKKRFFAGGGHSPVQVGDVFALEDAPERYSEDKYWMPRLVMMAKNTYVWLDQLSRKYQREIKRLDQIPDEELDRLASWGIRGLWLIGLWERSNASREIKQRMGAHDAVASAYSLMDYRIANDFGGEQAMENLRSRAWQRGIRMASDMVPNHTGIDSHWMIHNPDRFLSLDYPPFPSYSFNGPDLCQDDRVGVYLEDHYYNHSDAAVVFKRLDHYTGSTKYIYHGNDGTSMPWNDTAQLDYLNPETREAVIQTILSVARQFPIIRFDAAMTLANKHIQRLWFPSPGSGGDIPSRAEYGLTQEEFNRLMPKEFWTEVVDRVAAEVPDTLLLAEAFWMMEGYFVRSLGMHRVYNSAFMHMLRDENNAGYRKLIKETLEFDPQILKRYVNFMNNPDEDTAVAQFGRDNKYFGVCSLLATLPGLPMLGHGQVEGFSEKYGMEYQRAKLEEVPDEWLLRRHEQQIFPILHKRYLFAEVEHFRLYDFYQSAGGVDENVYAFSNRFEDQRALVIYHNHFGDTQGWVKQSAAYLRKDGDGNKQLTQCSLVEGLGFSCEADQYVIFRDASHGLEYIRNCLEIAEQGLFVNLDAYKTHVFLDFRMVKDDNQGTYRQLAESLNGSGVVDMNKALRELALKPVLIPYRELVNPGMFRFILDSCGQPQEAEALRQTEEKLDNFLKAVKMFTGSEMEFSSLVPPALSQIGTILNLKEELAGPRFSKKSILPAVNLFNEVLENNLFKPVFLAKLILESAAEFYSADGDARAMLEDWLLGDAILETLKGLGGDEGAARYGLQVLGVLFNHGKWFMDEAEQHHNLETVLKGWLDDLEVQQYIQVNAFEDQLWFNKEAFEDFLRWMFASQSLIGLSNTKFDENDLNTWQAPYTIIKQIMDAIPASECQLESLMTILSISGSDKKNT